MAPPTLLDGTRIRFAPGVNGLRALGVQSIEELLDPDRLPFERSETLERTPDTSLVRYRERGGDWLRLRRYTGGSFARRLAARVTAPRSESLAERAWNLACHLRAAGVGTPELVAVGSRGRGPVARDSFLLTREPDGFETLPQWLAQDLSPRARRLGATSVGLALGKLLRAGVELPVLRAEHVLVSIEPDDDKVAAAAPAGEGADHGHELDHGHEHGSGPCGLDPDAPPPNRMPSVVITALEGGRIRRGPTARAALELLTSLRRGVEHAPPFLVKRAAALALRALPERERRGLWRDLARTPGLEHLP